MIFINWGTIKGMFDYKALYREIYGEIADSLRAYFFTEKETALKVPALELSKHEFEFSEKPDSVSIPKIGIEAPLIVSTASQDKELEGLLKKGVVFYPESVMPGETGVTVVLGHSAPPGWPKINYDWVFTRLNELKPGDEIFIYFNHRKYPYKVLNKLILKRGDEIPGIDLSEQKSFITLLSCWPPGVDNKRIAIQAELEF